MRDYKGLIFTNHALERLRQRGISQGDAWATFRNPDQSRKGSAQGSWVYYKTYGNERVEVVAKKNERGEWIVLSVWSKPVYGRRAKKQGFIVRVLKKLLFGK